jgi:tetratricopeptide (TPR) repeat protein
MDRFNALLLGGVVLVVAVVAGRQSFDASARPEPSKAVNLLSTPSNTGTPARLTAAAPTAPKQIEKVAVALPVGKNDTGETPDDYVYPTAANVARRAGAPGSSPAFTSPRGKAVVATSAPSRVSASAGTPNYERAVADAVTLGAEDLDRAARRLERITTDEPSRPQAYENLAAIRLRQGDYYQAYEMYDSAIRNDGKATFSILHDHTRGNFDSGPKSTCAGELSIMPAGVKFEGGDGHRFAASWAELQETGANRFFGSGIGGFHVKVTNDGKSKNFNLAPRSKDKREANLILDLLIENAQRQDASK